MTNQVTMRPPCVPLLVLDLYFIGQTKMRCDFNGIWLLNLRWPTHIFFYKHLHFYSALILRGLLKSRLKSFGFKQMGIKKVLKGVNDWCTKFGVLKKVGY